MDLSTKDILHSAIEEIEGVKWLLLALIESPNEIENASMLVLYNSLEKAGVSLKSIKE